MNVEVYHLNNEKAIEQFGLNAYHKMVSNPTISSTRDAYAARLFEKVAEVYNDGCEHFVACEKAWQETQHGDASWKENTEHLNWVTDEKVRSSSIGDVFKIGTSSYLCDKYGWVYMADLIK